MSDHDRSSELKNLSPAQRALLLKQLRQRAAPRAKQTIPPRPASGSASLSFSQERLWFLYQLEPDNLAYNIPLAFHARGRLRLATLVHSLNLIVQRHEALRTTVTLEDDQPVQVIHPHQPLTIATRDLRHLPPAEAEAAARRLTIELAQQPFDLQRGPLLRAAAFTLAEHEHILFLMFHHIVTDGWSSGVLIRELSTIYSALVAGQPEAADLPPLTIQYADFAVWQRQWLQGQVRDEQLRYWQQQLQDVPALLALPTDRPRPAVQTQRGALHEFVLPPALNSALNDFSRQAGGTLFMTLLAAFQVLLHRYSGQEDIVVGTPVSNRRWRETEDLIGLFVNTLVLRTPIQSDRSFREVLQCVQEGTLAAFAHQDLPFEQLAAALATDRDMSRNPLFQVLFVLQNAPTSTLQLPDLTLTSLKVDTGTAAFDLMLSLIEMPHGLAGCFEYSTDLFDAATIARMTEHFETLLAQVITTPDRAVGAYSLIQPEMQPLLPDPRLPLIATTHETVDQLIMAVASAQPGHPAIRHRERQWSYSELAAHADALAETLRAAGVEPGMVVAVGGQRSFGLIASMLAVLCSRAVLLTLDTRLPPARQQIMLREAGAACLLLSGDAPATAVAARELALVLHVAAETGVVGERSVATGNLQPTRAFRDGDPAYIFFTSGSTGVPKGVLGSHRSLSHFLLWQRATFAIGPDDRAAQLTGLSFDVVLRDIFLPLISGATLCLPPSADDLRSGQILPWLERERISLLHTVPTLAQSWLDDVPAQVQLRALRWLFFAGEPLTETLVRRWRAAFPQAGTIVNLYGPTETTLAKCAYVVGDEPVAGIQPVGRPLPETQALVLTAQGTRCAIGEPGEIAIRTPYRSLGYINADDQQARFIANPFRDDPDDLIYLTGDRGRHRADGLLDILGRVDDQVKIRGVRVELSEVQAVLSRHPDVRAAAVLARQPTPHSKQLVAYVVPRRERAATIGGRKRYKLPNQMAVAQLNKNETDYLYREIFELQAYTRHGITLRDGACVVDVGGNIGLFTIFVHQLCREPRVYTFEPNPTTLEVLRANTSLYAPHARLFNFGIADQAKQATFTFFPSFSMLSGFYADAAVERQTVRAYAANQQRPDQADSAEIIQQVDALLDERFEAQQFTAELRTLSEVIAAQELEQIDLLKINVEKSELDVLRGIGADDWAKIQQIVLEVDVAEYLAPIVTLLEQHGYDCMIEQDLLLTNTELHYIYAIRHSAPHRLLRTQTPGAHLQPIPPHDTPPALSVGELRRYLEQHLPPEMIPAAFVLLEELPLTANGKIDRSALATLEVERPEAAFVPPRTPVEQLLAQIWRETLGRTQIGIHDNFFDLGGDSIMSIRLIAKANRAGLDLVPKQLFQHQTIAKLAALVQASGAAVPAATGGFPLTPLQQQLLALHQAQQPYAARLLALPDGAQPEHLEQALRLLLLHHDALRTRFPADQPGRQQIPPTLDTPPVCPVVDDLPAAGPARTEQLQSIAASLGAQLDPQHGQLIQAAFLASSPAAPAQALIVADRLVLDAPSWQILLDGLQTAISQLQRDAALALPPKTAPFAAWVEQLLGTQIDGAELAFWQTLAAPDTARLPQARPGDQHAASLDTQSLALSAEETTLLRTVVPDAYHIPVHDALLAVVAQGLAQWAGGPVPIMIAGSARAAIATLDTTRTIGCFATRFPVLLRLDGDASIQDRLKAAKQQLHAVPRGGVSYGLLETMRSADAQAAALPPIEVAFEYDADQPAALLDEAPALGADYPLYLRAGLRDEQLYLTSHYDVARLAPDSIERALALCLEALRAVIARSQEPDAGAYVPSDFPKLALNQRDLDDLLAELGDGANLW